jgi:hypothetical protein
MAKYAGLSHILYRIMALAIFCAPAIAQTDVYPNSRCYIKLVSAQSGDQIWLDGTSTITVALSGSGESGGGATDTNGNGLDDAAMRLQAWTFTGTSVIHGPVQLGLRASSSSIGRMEEQANNTPGTLDVAPFTPTGQVSSFFDVFLELRMLGQTLYNIAPIHVTGILGHEPALKGDIYEYYSSTPLYIDGSGLPSGYAITELVYYPYIPTCGDYLHPYPIADLSHDCRVNFIDVALLATHWLECTHPDCIDNSEE